MFSKFNNNAYECIVQWNCDGVRKKKDELLNVINDVKPRIVALQEIMMQETKEMRIPHYNIIMRAGHFIWRSHGGVMLIIHESVPMTDKCPDRGTSSGS